VTRQSLSPEALTDVGRAEQQTLQEIKDYAYTVANGTKGEVRIT
jgi:hypothetical protein